MCLLRWCADLRLLHLTWEGLKPTIPSHQHRQRSWVPPVQWDPSACRAPLGLATYRRLMGNGDASSTSVVPSPLLFLMLSSSLMNICNSLYVFRDIQGRAFNPANLSSFIMIPEVVLSPVVLLFACLQFPNYMPSCGTTISCSLCLYMLFFHLFPPLGFLFFTFLSYKFPHIQHSHSIVPNYSCINIVYIDYVNKLLHSLSDIS